MRQFCKRVQTFIYLFLHYLALESLANFGTYIVGFYRFWLGLRSRCTLRIRNALVYVVLYEAIAETENFYRRAVRSLTCAFEFALRWSGAE